MIFNLSDTIAAISSAPGYGRRGIVRLSGPLAIDVTAKCWHDDVCGLSGEEFGQQPTWQAIKGRFEISETVIVPAEAVIFRPPASYTSEMMVELHLPGSQKLLNMVLEKLVSFESVRLAEAGEFTGRAFLNGRIDLTEAESVAEVIHACGDAQLRAAENLMAGMLHKKCSGYSQGLADLLALVEAGIDFCDQEGIEFIDNERLIEGVEQVSGDIDTLLKDSESWQDLHSLARVVLIGPPNAGKSSLVNLLTGLDRSIVCSIAGTTRDVLSAPVKLGLGECLLIDTPGLGDVDDPLGAVSQQRVYEIIREAELVLLLWDPSEVSELGEILHALREAGNVRVLSVANKKDLYSGSQSPDSGLDGLNTDLFISASTGENVDVLLEKMADLLHFGDNYGRAEAVALTARQASALSSSNESLKRLLTELRSGLDEAELIALELREALDHIGSVSGEIASDDVLGRIFSKFCIGK